jgi:uncharacterized membrane protein
VSGAVVLLAVLAVLLIWWLWKEILFLLAVAFIAVTLIGIYVVFHQVQLMS